MVLIVSIFRLFCVFAVLIGTSCGSSQPQMLKSMQTGKTCGGLQPQMLNPMQIERNNLDLENNKYAIDKHYFYSAEYVRHETTTTESKYEVDSYGNKKLVDRKVTKSDTTECFVCLSNIGLCVCMPPAIFGCFTRQMCNCFGMCIFDCCKDKNQKCCGKDKEDCFCNTCCERCNINRENFSGLHRIDACCGSIESLTIAVISVRICCV